jgi:hypothetical protein
VARVHKLSGTNIMMTPILDRLATAMLSSS